MTGRFGPHPVVGQVTVYVRVTPSTFTVSARAGSVATASSAVARILASMMDLLAGSRGAAAKRRAPCSSERAGGEPAARYPDAANGYLRRSPDRSVNASRRSLLKRVGSRFRPADGTMLTMAFLSTFCADNKPTWSRLGSVTD